MTAIAWAIVWAAINISSDNFQREGKLEGSFGIFMMLCWLAALAMVIACTVKEWK